jgi:hypothetical protein
METARGRDSVRMPVTPREVRASGAAEPTRRACRLGGPLPCHEAAAPRWPLSRDRAPGRQKFDLTYAMDNRQILIANLSKGQIGEQASNLLGSLLISHLHVVTMRRSSLPRTERVPFFVMVDEFQNFGTDAFASLFSEARKFGCFMCCATQFSSALNASTRAAVLGNAGSLIVFRVGASDAKLLAPELHPLPASELMDQMPFRAWMRRASQYGHSEIRCLPPLYEPRGRLDIVRAQSRRNFGRPRELCLDTYCD